MPCPGKQAPGNARVSNDWKSAGEAELTSVRVAAEQELETHPCSLPVGLGTVTQQDGGFVFRDSGPRTNQIIREKKVRVINSRKPEALTILLDAC